MPNLTPEQYAGNELWCTYPGVQGPIYRYYEQNGYGDVYNGQLISGSFSVNNMTTIFVSYDRLIILHNSFDKLDFWQWSNRNSGEITQKSNKTLVTEPKLRKIINKQVGSSRIWDYFHTRVLELFEKATFFGDYRDI